MFRLAILAALCAGLPLCADDPPKKLTPEERKELESKWREAMLASKAAYQAGKFAEATTAIRDALQLARLAYPKSEFPQGQESVRLTLDQLALMLELQGKLEEAEPHYREALGLVRQVVKGDSYALSLRLARFGILLTTLGKPSEAEALLRESLDMNRRLFKGDHQAVAASLTSLAVSLRDQGKLADAEPYARDALAMFERLHKGDHLEIATSMSNLAFVFQAQGRLTDAEVRYREALAMTRRLAGGDHPRVAIILDNLAGVMHEQGRLAAAEPLYREALEMRQRIFKGDHHDTAIGMNSLASVLQDQGKLTEATRLLKDTLTMQLRLFKGDHPDVATTLVGLSSLLQDQGQLAEAEGLLRDALKMRQRLFKGDHPDIAAGLNNLARLLRHQGKLTDAEPVSRAALAMFKRLHAGDHPMKALAMSNHASQLIRLGKVAEVEPLAREALEMRTRLFVGDNPAIVDSLALMAYLRLAQGHLADAEQPIRDALAMSRRLFDAYAKERSESDGLMMALAIPMVRDGYLSITGESKAEPAGVYSEVWLSKSAVTRAYEQRQQATRASTDPHAVKLIAARADARQRRAELLVAPVTKDPATRKQREDDLKSYEKRIAELDRALRPHLPTIDRHEKLASATPARLREVLPPNTAVVDFLHYTQFEYDRSTPGTIGEKQSDRYVAFVISRDRIGRVELPGVDKVREAIHTWREAITSGKQIPAAIPARVRELVWEKVRKELPANIQTVYIAPDQALCRVPWGALPGDKPGTILLEDFAIATIPHAPFLLDKLWPQDPLKHPPSGALVVGGVNFDAEATTGPANRDLPVKPGAKIAWQALPGAAAEATGVTSAAEKKKLTVTSLKGEAATPAAVLAALPKAKHAHFATHGFFADPSFRSAFQLDEKDFQRSLSGERIGRAALSPLVMTGLVFAGANNPKTPGRGIVTGEALVDLDLSELELAVLSACDTGLGDVAGGEGTFGLQRAFHLAGTRDVIASLWKVPDAPTAALMAEFYRNLWERNLTPMESLRQAQLFIYRNPGKIADLAAGFRAGFKEVPGSETQIKPTADGKSHPRLWAAFTLSGPGR